MSKKVLTNINYSINAPKWAIKSKNMKNKILIIVALISVLFVVSCGNQPIDKSKYEITNLKDAGLGTIFGTSEPNANETKMFVARAKYREFSEGARVALGVDKGQATFADPETDVISIFDIKGEMPDMKDGQMATIYFRLERKDGRVNKVAIDLIEKIVTVYQAGETFQVENFDSNGQKTTYEIKTGTVKENEQEVENWVAANSKGDAAMYLLLMYRQNLDKDKVDRALSDWKNLGGGSFIILLDKNGNPSFRVMGRSGSIFDMQGNGNVKVKTLDEKTDNNVSEGENDCKYVITDIDFSKD